jgi:hypothetical protein
MKRKLPGIIIALAVVILAAGFLLHSFRPSIGEIAESWETTNQTFKVRVDRHAEKNGGFVPGAYYVFRSAPSASNDWREIMTFRHDDPNPIPRDQVRFVNDRVGYVFMGWMYAVTLDGGGTWSVWNADTELPKWECCPYGLIGDVNIEPDGTGTMILHPIPKRQGEVPRLHTKDFGQHWDL